LHDAGKLADAEPLHRAAIALLRQRAPSPHPQLAVHVNNLGALLEDQQRFDEAEGAYREAASLRRALLGREHPGVARTLNNLARLMLVRGRPADALPIVDEALAIRRAALGDADVETVTSKDLRGSILAALGRRAAR
jgi:Flp pilus assembly protein TadD